MDTDSRELKEKFADSELSGLREAGLKTFCVASRQVRNVSLLKPPFGAWTVRVSPDDRLKTTLWITNNGGKPFSF